MTKGLAALALIAAATLSGQPASADTLKFRADSPPHGCAILEDANDPASR